MQNLLAAILLGEQHSNAAMTDHSRLAVG
jgi:hypothetical protein